RRRFATAVCQRASDDQSINTVTLQELMQVARTGHKGPEAGLLDEVVGFGELELRPQLPVMRIAREGSRGSRSALRSIQVREPIRPTRLGTGVNRHAQIDIPAATTAHGSRDQIDVRDDLPCHRYLDRSARFHEAVLQVDGDVRGVPHIESLEGMESSALRLDLTQQFSSEANRVHT